MSEYFISGSLCSVSIGISLHPETTDDMDRRAFLQFGEVLNMVSFPCDDSMPSDFNDLCAVFCGVAVVSCDGEVGNFGVHEILHVNAPDDAPEDVPYDWSLMNCRELAFTRSRISFLNGRLGAGDGLVGTGGGSSWRRCDFSLGTSAAK